jgi:phospholipid-binding lipoprotein MlaA
MFETKVLQRLAIAGVVAMSVTLGGCATKPDPTDEAAVQAYQEANDPLEPMNRYFFSVNMFLDEVLLKPFAGYYNIALPQVAKDGIRGILRNVDTPVILANDLFQGEGNRAGITTGRFFVNTTLGLGGFFDVAKHFGMPYHDEDFGQTLAVWGTGEGPYLMLPLLGPSNPRDASGKIVDKFLDPMTYIGYIYDVDYINTIRGGLEAIDTRARNLQAIDELQKGSIDFYATVRSLYRQHRNDAIRNGKEDEDLTPKVTSELDIPANGAPTAKADAQVSDSQ